MFLHLLLELVRGPPRDTPVSDPDAAYKLMQLNENIEFIPEETDD